MYLNPRNQVQGKQFSLITPELLEEARRVILGESDRMMFNDSGQLVLPSGEPISKRDEESKELSLYEDEEGDSENLKAANALTRKEIHNEQYERNQSPSQIRLIAAVAFICDQWRASVDEDAKSLTLMAYSQDYALSHHSHSLKSHDVHRWPPSVEKCERAGLSSDLNASLTVKGNEITVGQFVEQIIETPTVSKLQSLESEMRKLEDLVQNPFSDASKRYVEQLIEDGINPSSTIEGFVITDVDQALRDPQFMNNLLSYCGYGILHLASEIDSICSEWEKYGIRLDRWQNQHPDAVNLIGNIEQIKFLQGHQGSGRRIETIAAFSKSVWPSLAGRMELAVDPKMLEELRIFCQSEEAVQQLAKDMSALSDGLGLAKRTLEPPANRKLL